MKYFLPCIEKRYPLIIVWILFQSCTIVPPAEFYEVDGIVSIESNRLSHHEGWNPVNQFSTVSLISNPDSSGYVEPLTFPFYIQQPGSYTLWILDIGDRISSEVNNVSVSLLDERGDQLYQTFIKNDITSLLMWKNLDYEDQSISFAIHQTGHYRINVRPLGVDGYAVNKIHLTLNNETPPQGAGLPTTSDPGQDPLLQKREQRMELPPSWILGPVYGGYSKEGVIMGEEDILRPENAEMVMRQWDPSMDYGQYEISELKKNIELMANPRFITYEVPYASYNVGGFDYNKLPPFNEELLIRWSQFSSLNSVMHLFSKKVYESLLENNQLSEHSYRYINELIHLRERLFPYLYSEYHLARGTGIKPIRGSSDFPTQYMFGDSFLVAPVFEMGEYERFVNLPSGIWYDYDNGTQYEGGQSWLVEAPLYRIPFFVKAGSIIPYITDQKSTYTAHYDSLMIDIYGGSVGSFRLYEDDGLTTQYKQGEYSTTAFRYFERDDYATFTIGKVTREFDGQSRNKVLTLIFKYIQKPKSVSANQIELSEGNSVEQWYFDDEKEQMILNWVQSNDIKTDFEITF